MHPTFSPGKGSDPPLIPETYPLKVEPEFRQVLMEATENAGSHAMSAIGFKMGDDREHPVRELVLKVAFGQTRAPASAMGELAARLSACTDRRTGSSLMITTVHEAGERRRVSVHVFPEEDSYRLRQLRDEAILERLRSFALRSKLRKVARFEGKNIKTHFLQGEVADLQIGSDPRTAADYWVAAFLDAEFSINSNKGTRLVAAGLHKAFAAAGPRDKQAVMEAAIALVADRRQTWSLDQIASKLVPDDLVETFCSVAPNPETRSGQFVLDKDLLRNRINYRVFQLNTGVWVSSPFQEVGESVTISKDGDDRTLSCRGVVIAEKVRSDKPESMTSGPSILSACAFYLPSRRHWKRRSPLTYKGCLTSTESISAPRTSIASCGRL